MNPTDLNGLEDIKRRLDDLESKKSDKVQRWQKITLDQFGYALNQSLTLAVAALGYCFQLLRDSSYQPNCVSRCYLIIALALLISSVGLGGWCVRNRLKDFRETTNRARGKYNRSIEEVRAIGNSSWSLLNWHMGTFGLGIVFLAITIFATYYRKI